MLVFASRPLPPNTIYMYSELNLGKGIVFSQHYSTEEGTIYISRKAHVGRLRGCDAGGHYHQHILNKNPPLVPDSRGGAMRRTLLSTPSVDQSSPAQVGRGGFPQSLISTHAVEIM